MFETLPFFHPLSVESVSLPKQFTFPFFYEPHPLSLLAADQVKMYLRTQQDFKHPFWSDEQLNESPIGKMFGVMVVKDSNGNLGFLAAVSGKLANTNKHAYFVPPIYDILDEEGFFRAEEHHINRINRDIEHILNGEAFAEAKTKLEEVKYANESALKAARELHKANKKERKQIRSTLDTVSKDVETQAILEDLIKQSYRDQHEYDVLKLETSTELNKAQSDVDQYIEKIERLKEERKRRSAALQKKIFDQYQFLNALGETKDVLSIFQEAAGIIPPAGAGECAAPKLFQYAYLNQLTPICMAEFWWGTSSASEVRLHEHYYPSCRGKCEPILGFMMQGLDVESNPLLQATHTPKGLDIVFEDNDILVVNKPSELLSVPGKQISDSVFERAMELRPDMTGPIIIHRLDMSTSGILVLAKNKEAHQFIQDQFIQHTIVKRYTALLNGVISEDEGLIDLPLRVDLDDRPRQMVCYTYGKPARTQFRVIERKNDRTKIHFFPLTGRTHQLRVHSAHSLGLHTPIVGDDIYGTRENRLHLHAGFIGFIHPTSGEEVSFEVPDPF